MLAVHTHICTALALDTSKFSSTHAYTRVTAYKHAACYDVNNDCNLTDLRSSRSLRVSLCWFVRKMFSCSLSRANVICLSPNSRPVRNAPNAFNAKARKKTEKTTNRIRTTANQPNTHTHTHTRTRISCIFSRIKSAVTLLVEII